MSKYEDFVNDQYAKYYETYQDYKEDLDTFIKMEQDTIEILAIMHESIQILKDKVEILEKFLKSLKTTCDENTDSTFTGCV